MNGQGTSPPQCTGTDYTIAICTWNRAERLTQTLTRLLDLKIPEGVSWQLLVVDNNSTDHTQEVLRRFEGQLPLSHHFEPRQGKSHALNRGVRHATGRWILWTDDDVLVPPDWLAGYLSQRNHRVAGVCVFRWTHRRKTGHRDARVAQT